MTIIPPSPALIGFEDWKLNVPTSPIAPTGVPAPCGAVRLGRVLDDLETVAAVPPP